MGRLTPPQMLIISFLCVILLGAVALSLPVATNGAGRLSFVDSLFTATSATCVTGLAVKDTGSYFSTFGRWVIFALFQAGGLGIMTFSTLFAVLLGRKIGFRESDVIRATLDKHSILGLKKLITYILIITIVTELAGAACLFFRWRHIADWTVQKTAENAIFHSVSGFCNAGFSLFKDSLVKFGADPVINVTMLLLIFIGGIGFVVILDMMGLLYKKPPARKLSLQSKIALSVSVVLVAAGALFFFLVEKNNTLQGMDGAARAWSAVFQSVTARTAGFNTIAIESLRVPSKVFMTFLMFVGASPGSTGGGIKTCTFAILIVTVFCVMKNRKRVTIFGRSVPEQVVRESLVIFFLSMIWIFVFTILLTYFDPGKRAAGSLMNALFEVTSAFGTVGLSTGITSRLSEIGKICLTVTMFAGRLGPLTLALAVASRERTDKYSLPEENIMVG